VDGQHARTRNSMSLGPSDVLGVLGLATEPEYTIVLLYRWPHLLDVHMQGICCADRRLDCLCRSSGRFTQGFPMLCRFAAQILAAYFRYGLQKYQLSAFISTDGAGGETVGSSMHNGGAGAAKAFVSHGNK
jgi:hypothetical protein